MAKLLDAKSRAVRIPLPADARVEVLAPHAIGVLDHRERDELNRGFTALLTAAGDPTGAVGMILRNLLCAKSSLWQLNGPVLALKELPPEILGKIAYWFRQHMDEYHEPLRALPAPKYAGPSPRESYLRKMAGAVADPELRSGYLALAAAERQRLGGS